MKSKSEGKSSVAEVCPFRECVRRKVNTHKLLCFSVVLIVKLIKNKKKELITFSYCHVCCFVFILLLFCSTKDFKKAVFDFSDWQVLPLVLFCAPRRVNFIKHYTQSDSHRKNEPCNRHTLPSLRGFMKVKSLGHDDIIHVRKPLRMLHACICREIIVRPQPLCPHRAGSLLLHIKAV